MPQGSFASWARSTARTASRTGISPRRMRACLAKMPSFTVLDFTDTGRGSPSSTWCSASPIRT